MDAAAELLRYNHNFTSKKLLKAKLQVHSLLLLSKQQTGRGLPDGDGKDSLQVIRGRVQKKSIQMVSAAPGITKKHLCPLHTKVNSNEWLASSLLLPHFKRSEQLLLGEPNCLQRSPLFSTKPQGEL